jgi:DNA-binding NtrC family response regulator
MKRESRIHVLLVEDDPTQAALTRSLLRQQFDGGLRLWETTHVEVALDHLQDPSVEVVLLDLDLPDSRGMATVERVIKAAPEVPIVVLTGHDDHKMRAAALAHGAHAYLVKGLANGPVLEEAVSNAAKRRRLIVETPASGEPFMAQGSGTVPRGTGQRILLVEGQPAMRATLTQMLRAHGYRVQPAADGNEALEHFIASPSIVEAVVTDLFVPTVGSETLCRSIRRLNSALPIIMSVDHADASAADLSAGPPDQLAGAQFLQKPHTADALLRMLHQVLSSASEP